MVKLRLPFLILFLVVIVTLAIVSNARADGPSGPLTWDTPYGNFNLNLTASQALIGYDAVLKQAIGGFSLPVYTDPKGIVTLQAGAGAPWPTNGATVEPLLLAGHDILREIPGLSQYQNASLNIFARYATSVGKAGVGLAFSYAFAGGTTAPIPSPAPAQ